MSRRGVVATIRPATQREDLEDPPRVASPFGLRLGVLKVSEVEVAVRGHEVHGPAAKRADKRIAVEGDKAELLEAIDPRVATRIRPADIDIAPWVLRLAQRDLAKEMGRRDEVFSIDKGHPFGVATGIGHHVVEGGAQMRQDFSKAPELIFDLLNGDQVESLQDVCDQSFRVGGSLLDAEIRDIP